jgi:outer membrane immunogenic protein
MKNLWLRLLGVAAAGLGTTAMAADMPMKARPMEAAAYSWTGFYIGGNVGFGRSSKSWDYFDGVGYTAEGDHNATGPTAGGQIGYRMQAGSWVYGVEAQGNWANLRGYNTSTGSPSEFFDTDNHTRIDSFGLFTGQIGYAWGAALLYVRGGAAVVNERFSIYDTFSPTLLAETRATRWGGTVGAGLEYGFTPNWTAGISYDHVFLDTKNFDIGAVGGGVYQTDRIRQDLDIVTLRLNYKFGYAAPVVARY